MHLRRQLSLLFSAAALFSSSSAQTTTSTAATASVTLVNFAALPSCATSCGPLYDAQGTCTPPGSAVTNFQTYEECFCAFPSLQSFYTESNGVCPNACAADTNGPQELVEIQSWFTSFCASATGTATGTATSSSATSTSTTKSSSDNSSNSSGSQTASQKWFHTHWKWVVMIIVLFIGITTIWVGAACIRRRIHRKREREIEMRPPVALGPHQLQSMTGGIGLYTDGVVDSVPNARNNTTQGEKVRVNAAATQVYGGGGGDGLGFDTTDEKKPKEKKEKRKWIVKERT